MRPKFQTMPAASAVATLAEEALVALSLGAPSGTLTTPTIRQAPLPFHRHQVQYQAAIRDVATVSSGGRPRAVAPWDRLPPLLKAGVVVGVAAAVARI